MHREYWYSLFRRRSRGHRTQRCRGTEPRSLGLELCEPRLVLCGALAIDYDSVSPPWFETVVEADRRGSILAIIRLGDKDIEMPGASGGLAVGMNPPPIAGLQLI